MKRQIESDSDGVTINISEIRGHNKKLIEAFQECQAGRCHCPTNEYKKLESLVIKKEKDQINLRLDAKEGEIFDTEEIEKCIEYMQKKINTE